MKALILGAALAACAAPALAGQADDYLMKAPEGDHPGRQYVSHGVRVIEGQPRWAVQNRQVVDDIFLLPDQDIVNVGVNNNVRADGPGIFPMRPHRPPHHHGPRPRPDWRR
jgi:hypothetical protein